MHNRGARPDCYAGDILMDENRTLPSDRQILATPPLASLATLHVALKMTCSQLRCEHPELDELDGYVDEKRPPPQLMVLAHLIVNLAQELGPLVSSYLELEENKAPFSKTIDLPF